MDKIHRYRAKKGITEKYLKKFGFNYGGNIGFDSAFMSIAFQVELEPPKQANGAQIKFPFIVAIGFDSDFNSWTDEYGVCVLEGFTGSVYGPFYAVYEDKEVKNIPPVLPHLIDAYNQFMDSLPFLTRI